MAEEACVELHQYSYIIQRFIITLFFLPPTVPNLVPNSKRQNNSVPPSSLYTKASYPLFPSNRPANTHPRGHTPISQNGSIAPVYILFWKFEKSRVVKAFPVIELFIAIHTLPFWIINTDYASSEG